MHMEFDGTATPEERNRAFRQAHEDFADMIYKREIERGVSAEEAARIATKIRDNVLL